MGKKARSKASAKKKPGPSGGGGRGTKKKNKQSADPFGAEPSASASQKQNHNGNDNDGDIGVHSSVYQVYKTATLRFKEQLTKLVPAAIFKKDYVQSFLDAADYVNDNDVAVDADLLSNLRVAISVRKKYSRRLEDGGDEGHAYFLLVLNYCLQVLKRCSSGKGSKVRKVADDIDDENKNDELPDETFFNKFGALSMDAAGVEQESDSEDEDSSDDDNGDTPAARPQPPSNKEYTYDDLMSFPDTTKCLFLFDTMAYHASKFSLGMRNLKETMRMEANGEYKTENLAGELIMMGAFANSMVLDVQNLETSLYLECPALGESPYRLLGCCFLSPIIKIVSDNVRQYSPLARKFKDDMALAYLGDIVEAVFRCDLKRPDKIAEQWVKRWRLPEYWRMKARWLVSCTVQIVMKNCWTVSESLIFNRIPEEKIVAQLPKWMEGDFGWDEIGGERSIFNTMRLVDMFGSNMDCGDKKVNDGGKDHVFINAMTHMMNQPQWDGDENLASSIRGDMDALLIKMFMCILESKWRMDGRAVPHEKKMLPLVHAIRVWTEGGLKSKPSFTLIFSLHLMLSSLVDLQGDGDVSRIGSIAKSAYGKFMSQTKEHLELDIPCNFEREECLKFILDTKRVTERVYREGDPPDRMDDMMSPEIFDLLFWNPLCAGLFLGYTRIYLSLEGGFTAMTTSCETIAILHLYNALKVRGVVDDDLPLLGDFDRYFDRSKCFWNGWEKPQQGKFTYRFHLSMGATNEMAMWSQDMARFKVEGGENPPTKPNVTLSQINRNRKTSTRVATTIDPSEVSNTFKRYCAFNYDDMEEEMQGPHVPKHLKLDPDCLLPMPWQIFDAKTYLGSIAMASELDNLLKYNMTAVGTIFSEFLFEAFHPDKNEGVAKFQARMDLPCDHPGDIRSLINLSVTEEVLASLDYDQETFDFLGDAFEEFFCNLDMDRVCLY